MNEFFCNQKPLPRMRGIKQAAHELQIPEYALRRWVKAGDVPAVWCGRKALINLDTLIEYLRGGAGDE